MIMCCCFELTILTHRKRFHLEEQKYLKFRHRYKWGTSSSRAFYDILYLKWYFFDRFASLLRNITSLLCCENHGKAYECPPDRINAFLEWSECSFCLFFKVYTTSYVFLFAYNLLFALFTNWTLTTFLFQWVEKDQQMFCQMFNMSRMCVTFLVNPGNSSLHSKFKI